MLDGHAIGLGAAYPALPAAQFGIRPEFTILGRGDSGGLPVQVTRIEDLGRRRLARVTVGGHKLVATVPPGLMLDGAHASVRFDTAHLHVFRRGPARGRACRMTLKPLNNRAWLLVIPVMVFVLFSSLIPMMTVVNYSVQDSMGQNSFFWNGPEWFQHLLDPTTDIGGRFARALVRNLVFSAWYC